MIDAEQLGVAGDRHRRPRDDDGGRRRRFGALLGDIDDGAMQDVPR